MSDTAITIKSLDTKPRLDPYHAQVLGESSTELIVDPEARSAWVEQRYASGSMTSDEYHQLVLTAFVPSALDANEVRDTLESPEVQALLTRVCDGFEAVWDGSNMTGQLSPDAQAAWARIQGLLIEMETPDPYWRTWELPEWLSDLDVTQWGLEGVPAGATIADLDDDQIEALAEAIERYAEAEQVVLLWPDTTAEYLRRLRQQAWAADTTIYDTREVAALLGISPQRVRALAKSREVGFKVGNAWAFDRLDLEAMRERRPGRPAQGL